MGLLVLLDGVHIQDAGFPPRLPCLPTCSYTPQIFTEVPAVCQLLAQAVSFTWDAFSLPLPNPDPTYPLTLNANDISAPRPPPQAVPVFLPTCL